MEGSPNKSYSDRDMGMVPHNIGGSENYSYNDMAAGETEVVSSGVRAPPLLLIEDDDDEKDDYC